MMQMLICVCEIKIEGEVEGETGEEGPERIQASNIRDVRETTLPTLLCLSLTRTSTNTNISRPYYKY